MASQKEIKEQILSTLKKQGGAGKNIKSLAKALGIKGQLAEDMLANQVEDMLESGDLEMGKNVDYAVPQSKKFIYGTVDHVNPHYAFVVPDEEDESDIFVRAEDLYYALHGDRVKVLPREKKKGKKSSKREGEVVEILKRGQDVYVGKVDMLDNYAFILPDSRRMYMDIFVHKSDLMGAKDNDKVLVRIEEWPEDDKNPVGKVEKILGQAGQNDAEMHSILAEFGLPIDFPEEVEQEAEKFGDSIDQEEFKNRLDIRDTLTFTIDPVDAKDFDDAISFKELKNGNYEIGVHIADVSHYVRPGSLIEEEAFKRATSVYLVDRTIPMLPEKLSNNLCSLRPNEDRLAFSTLFKITPKGAIVGEWYGRTVIHSDRRMAYEDAQEIIEGKEDDLFKPLSELNRLALKFRKQRFRKGSIGFETTEVRFELDEQGKPTGVVPKKRFDAHKLIEEYMLLANKKVAEHVFKMKKGRNKLTMIYRIHEQPDYEKLRTFAQFARRFGHNIKTEGKMAISQSINKMLEETEGTAEHNLLSSLAIRTMAKARYSTENAGHFGLAFAHYSHFTSPIRRYPDVIAHRLLEHYLNGGDSADAEEIESQAKHSSEQERLAVDAERASVKYKQVEYIQMQDPDRTWEGVVSGISDFGIFVEIVENLCEGMVRLSDLSDDYYEYDEENYRLIGKRSKRIISFGEKVEVRVKDTNLERRTIDLELLIDAPGTPTQKPQRRARRKKKKRKNKS